MKFKKLSFKNIYQAHRWIGLFVAIHFAIFSVTGLILLFQEELQKGIQKESSVAQGYSLNAQQYALAYQYVAKAYPRDRVLSLFPDENDPNVMKIRLGINGSKKLAGARHVSIDAASGVEIKKESTQSSSFFKWILRLHREFLLGSFGKLYLGGGGIGLRRDADLRTSHLSNLYSRAEIWPAAKGARPPSSRSS